VESQIIFLGTGSGSVLYQQARGSGGIVIKSEGYQFLLDPGPGALVRAHQYGINLRQNTALLVSHAHVSHCSDANAVIGAMTHNGLDPKGVLIANKTFVEGTDGYRPVLSTFHQKCVERVITPEPGQKIGIENIEIHALQTKHGDPHALGYKLFTPHFVLSYLGDTGWDKSLVEQYKQSDILIINMPLLEKTDEHNLNKEQVAKLVKLVQPRLVILTHLGPKVAAADPLVLAREIKNATQVQTVAARDGMVLKPQSYAAELRHKTLNLYPKEGEVQIREGILESERASQDSTDQRYL